MKDCASKPWHTKESVSLGLSRGTYRNWRDTSMINAVEAVTKNEVSIRQAAELYRVPKSTLSDKVSSKVALSAKSGPPAYLFVEEEEELTSFLV